MLHAGHCCKNVLWPDSAAAAVIPTEQCLLCVWIHQEYVVIYWHIRVSSVRQFDAVMLYNKLSCAVIQDGAVVVTVSSCPSCMSLYCWMRRIRSWRRLRSIWLSRVMSMIRWRVVDSQQGRTHLLALLSVDPAHHRCRQTYHMVPP